MNHSKRPKPLPSCTKAGACVIACFLCRFSSSWCAIAWIYLINSFFCWFDRQGMIFLLMRICLNMQRRKCAICVVQSTLLRPTITWEKRALLPTSLSLLDLIHWGMRAKVRDRKCLHYLPASRVFFSLCGWELIIDNNSTNPQIERRKTFLSLCCEARPSTI